MSTTSVAWNALGSRVTINYRAVTVTFPAKFTGFYIDDVAIQVPLVFRFV
jgi:hypothetical protein